MFREVEALKSVVKVWAVLIRRQLCSCSEIRRHCLSGDIQSGWTYHTTFSFYIVCSLSNDRILHGMAWHGMAWTRMESYTVSETCFRVDKLTSEHMLKKTATSSGVISILTVSPPSSSPTFVVCVVCYVLC